MDWKDFDDLPGDEPEAQAYRVCRVEQLQEGRGRVVFAGTLKVAVFRIGDQIYAIKNACPHAGGSLGVGRVEAMTVACPRHDWQFHLGTGACVGRKMYSVETFPVEVRDGEVWVEVKGS